MEEATKELVRRRANDQCEYCRIPQHATPLLSHHVEHIVARQHHGTDQPDNLALACDRCNAFKGPNLTTMSAESETVIELFHPRKDEWPEHFAIENGLIIGKTEKGRATATLLNMNAPRRVQLRLLIPSP